MNKHKPCVDRKFVIGVIIASIILFIIHAFHIVQLYHPYLGDDWGYYLNAFYFNGYNTSIFVENMQYYSFGYSVILAILMEIFEDGLVAYRMALMFNSFCMVGVFLFAIKIQAILFLKVDKWFRLGIAFCISVYSAYILESSVSWSEAIQLLLIWSIFLLLLKYLQTDASESHYILVVMSATLGMLYIVHQRNIGVIIAFVITILCASYMDKRRWKHIFFMVIVLIGFMSIKELVEDACIRNMMIEEGKTVMATTTVAANTFSVRITQMLATMLSFEGIVGFLFIVVGHIYYFGAATFGLGYIGIAVSIVTVYQGVKQWKQNKLELFLFELFLLLSFFGTLAISCFSFAPEPNRSDMLIYGRYIEAVYMIFTVYGIHFLYKYGKNVWKPQFISLGIMAVCGVLSYWKLCSMENFIRPLSEMVTAVYPLTYLARAENEEFILLSILFSIAVGMLLTWLLSGKQSKWNYCAILIISIYWIFAGKVIVVRDLIPIQSKGSYYYKLVCEINKSNLDVPIYCVEIGDEKYTDKHVIQLYLKEKVLEIADKTIVESQESKYVIISKKINNKTLQYGLEEYQLLYEDELQYLYRKN